MSTDGSFEEEAGLAAHQAYHSVLLRSVALMLLSFTGLAVLVAGDWTWGILALWRLSRLLGVFLTGLILGEVLVIGVQLARRRRARRPRPGTQTDSEKMTAALDSLAAARDEPQAPLWWHAGFRTRTFWRGLVTRAVYSACCGLVVAAYAGVPAGIAAGVAWTALSVFFGLRSRSAAAGSLRAAAFADPRPPRDTPEM